jgi:hypothetical protein
MQAVSPEKLKGMRLHGVLGTKMSIVFGIEWRLDYHLSVRGILQGTPEAPGFALKPIKE